MSEGRQAQPAMTNKKGSKQLKQGSALKTLLPALRATRFQKLPHDFEVFPSVTTQSMTMIFHISAYILTDNNLSAVTGLQAWKAAATETGFDLGISLLCFWQIISLFVQVLLSTEVMTFLSTLPLQILVFTFLQQHSG